MPAAVSKSELRAVCAKEYARLMAVIEQFPEAMRYVPDEDGITPKDILGHRAHWIGLTLGWYRDGAAGKTPEIPAKGYKWSELKAYNAEIRARQADITWDQARSILQAAHETLMSRIDALENHELYGAPMPGGGNKWTAGRFFEAAGASHYRSAARYLRARRRAAA